MTFLPVVQRELVEASRRRGTYWIRVGVAALGLLIGGWVMFIPDLRVPSRIGMALFIPLSIVALIYCAFIGVFRAADCLSEEKRDGTLGLLFLTDLKGYDIVLGKLVATSLNAIYGVLALFPILAIPLLAGGVVLAELGRVVLVALNTLFFSLAVGMFCSAISRDERKAMALAVSAILFFVMGVPFVAVCLEEIFDIPDLGIWEFFAVPSPYFSALFAFEDIRRGNPIGAGYFSASVLFIHGLSWLLLIASSLIVPRTWQDRPLSAAALRRRQTIQQLGAGPPRRQLEERRARLSLNPVFWLVTRGRFKMAAVWAMLAIGAVIWMLGLLLNPNDWKDIGAYLMTAIIAHTLIKAWLVTEACRQFSFDRQSGALELLLVTTLSPRDIVRGQALGLEKQFAGPIFVILLADLVFLVAGRTNDGWIFVWVIGMVVFLADIFTLSWLGMWRGLNSRRPIGAATAALLRILVLPWILFAMISTFVVVTDALSGFHFHNWEEYAFALLYLFVSLGVNALFGLPARAQLLTRFREVATRRFEVRGRQRTDAS